MTRPAPPNSAGFAVEFAGVSKRFGAVVANDAVSFGIGAGAIHGIVGENGAGKSTLMSILYGFYQADAGSIRLRGQEARIRTSHQPTAPALGFAGYSITGQPVEGPSIYVSRKSRVAFVLLAIFFGIFGVHNFYAGYIKKAVIQLCITLFTCFYGAIIIWIWAVIEACMISSDDDGVAFT